MFNSGLWKQVSDRKVPADKNIWKNVKSEFHYHYPGNKEKEGPEVSWWGESRTCEQRDEGEELCKDISHWLLNNLGEREKWCNFRANRITDLGLSVVRMAKSVS